MASVLLVLFAVGLLAPLPAQAEDGAEAGTLVGTVTDLGGAPVGHLEVVAYRVGAGGAQEHERATAVAPDGTYSMEVPAGAYRLFIDAYSYPDRWHGGTSWEDAATIEVRAGSTVGGITTAVSRDRYVHTRLVFNGPTRGVGELTILDKDGQVVTTPLDARQVVVPSGSTAWYHPAPITLAPGSYTARATYLPDGVIEPVAKVIPFTVGADGWAGGLEFEFSGGPRVTFDGQRVTNEAGEPIAGITVVVYSYDPRTQALRSEESAQTDRQGAFHIVPMPYGEYWVELSDRRDEAEYRTLWLGKDRTADDWSLELAPVVLDPPMTEFSFGPVVLKRIGAPGGTPEAPQTPPTLTATVSPSISGSAVLGGTLSATPGAWNIGGATYSYTWLRGGVPIAGATGQAYRVTAPDLSAALSVRVTADKAGHVQGSATSGAVVVAKGGSTLRMTLVSKKVAARKRAKVKIVVSVPAGVRPAGKVTIRSGRTVVGSANISSSGRVTITLKKLKAGKKHALSATYAGTSQIAGSVSKKVTLKVSKK